LKFLTRCGLFAFILSISVFTLLKNQGTLSEITVKHDASLYSQHLHRSIVLDIILPPHYHQSQQSYPVLYMNDGQDVHRLQMTHVLEKTFGLGHVQPFILIAIHCGDRIQEYGTAAQADYKQRGSKAAVYTAFVLEELMPYIQKNFRVQFGAANTAFCGFSLGGLSAFDISWHNPYLFGKVGVFSGSFWWRQKAYENHYDDETDRIMHRLIRQSVIGNRQLAVGSQQSAVGNPNSQLPTLSSELGTQKFWFQTGTEDEKDDRNNNGVIDSIEDTLDLISELEKKGYVQGEDIRYVEVQGGQHDPITWSNIMPDFLKWAFGVK